MVKSTDARAHCLGLNSAWAVSSCVTLGRLLNLSGFQFHCLENGVNNGPMSEL